MRRSLPCLIAAGLLCLTSAASAQLGRLSVTVRDAETGEPVSGATVRVDGMPRTGRTGRGGAWRSSRVPAGAREIRVSRLGYAVASATVQVDEDGMAEHAVRLVPTPVAVEGVEGSALRRSHALEVRGFYDRQRRGHGAFMTHEEIERIRPMRTVELFYHIRGFMVKRDRLGQPYLASSRGNGSFSAECSAPLVFLDGTQLSWGANRFSSRGAGPLESINPESISAIEAYAGAAAVPEEWRLPGAGCGVVLIWTRAGDEG